MDPKEYLVAQSDNHWVVMEGPERISAAFSSRQVAIDAALLQAKADAAELKSAIVIVEEHGHMIQLYNSGPAPLGHSLQ